MLKYKNFFTFLGLVGLIKIIYNTNKKKKNYPRIIGITGYKRSGKDTIADYLVKHYGYKKLSFATPLKHICKYLFDLTEKELNGEYKEFPVYRYNNKSTRQLLQFVGTDLFRDQLGKFINSVESVWVSFLRREIKKSWSDSNFLRKLFTSEERYVIADVRFQDEVDFITEFGYTDGKVIKVVRKGKDGKKYSNDKHKSEQVDKLKDITMDIENKGTLEELYKKVDEFMKYCDNNCKKGEARY